MNLDMNFIDIVGDRLSEMRLLVEGAITLFEDEASVPCCLLRDADNADAVSAFNDIGAALYCLRRHVVHLQAAHHKEVAESNKADV